MTTNDYIQQAKDIVQPYRITLMTYQFVPLEGAIAKALHQECERQKKAKEKEILILQEKCLKFERMAKRNASVIAKYYEALRPTPQTKEAYKGKVDFEIDLNRDKYGLPIIEKRKVPWKAIKKIMNMISYRALSTKGEEND